MTTEIHCSDCGYLPNPCPICASSDVSTRMLRKASATKDACFSVECESCGYKVKDRTLELAIRKWNA